MSRRHGIEVMKRLCLLLGTLVLASACASDPQWEEVRKDLRGDNMKMKGFSEEAHLGRPPKSLKSDDLP